MLDLLEPRGLGGLDASSRLRQVSAALETWLSVQGLDGHVAWLDSPAALPVTLALRPLQVVSVDAQGSRDVPRGDAWPGSVEPIFFRRAAARSGSWAHLETGALLPLNGSLGLVSTPPPHPILGYAGPIDARLDLVLLAQLAAARPAWQWVLIGPLRGIDAVSLPRASNLHWVGEQPQALLPAFMARWHVGFLPGTPAPLEAYGLPWAIAEALAAGLAVVTNLRLARLAFASWPAGLVHAEAAADSFILACERGLAEPPALRRQRRLCAWHRWRASQRQGHPP